MRHRTRLRLYKGIFLAGALAAVLLWQVHWALAVPVLAADFVFDLAARRCPYCGRHYDIRESPGKTCPYCGKEL